MLHAPLLSPSAHTAASHAREIFALIQVSYCSPADKDPKLALHILGEAQE